MSKSKRKPNPIKNDDQVIAFGITGHPFPYRFGDLLQDFQSHKLTTPIKTVMLVRTKVHYTVTMSHTAGLRFSRASSKHGDKPNATRFAS